MRQHAAICGFAAFAAQMAESADANHQKPCTSASWRFTQQPGQVLQTTVLHLVGRASTPRSRSFQMRFLWVSRSTALRCICRAPSLEKPTRITDPYQMTETNW